MSTAAQPTPTTAAVVKGEKGFQFGHSRVGGKKRNITHAVRAMAEEMGIDPIRFMLSLLKNDTYMETQIVDGKKKRVQTVIPLELKCDLAKYIARFCYPVLTASQITGADEGPVEVKSVSVMMTELMLNPAAVEAAQKLALAMCEPVTPARPQLPAGGTQAQHDVTLEKDSRGQYR